ncbi:sulfite exporter TauE/SafE family protein [Pseudoalteromonas shioyasakiensis]|uniref:sulfite exporter TauE/SafE family protein n=1 Tax=Pseudoalteromonas TaxID=53246 RepID=UPI001021DEDE|nr:MULTISPECIES: sulfite exporter TauE/SafE family protein [Pseudoalteromonas]MCG9709756.1 sulfite exporter TauE/SafE family protein [Pseudoalteromonas sp. Isolate3]MCP4586993.1 sulfite exporter TauE/SafE family protein [Pseudoalteromonas sp.]MCQ8883155.1 sulfite exporter TauE/SafE family protein [Pseudoalteromonas shioyasakiensis]NIZ05536.1 sulfite exporter TauE/SafE family protein [Pseudoalteromonas sp. HF66]QWV05167.1 sulfite exporter TauE/SafE family protein [Pseudoalteromonas shioyasakien
MVLIGLGAAIIFAFAVEAMTGFGSIVIALTIAALFMDIQQAMLLLVPLNLLMTSVMVFKLRAYIQLNLLAKQILPPMLLGTMIGALLTPYFPAQLTKVLFALLIIWFAGRAIWQASAMPLSKPVQLSVIGGAGITHGLFASGGPLLVYAMARSGLDKTSFRATLLTIWLILNSCLTLWFLISGQLAGQLGHFLMLAPCVLFGALIGNYFHHTINQTQFLRLVFITLLLLGVLLCLTALWQW